MVNCELIIEAVHCVLYKTPSAEKMSFAAGVSKRPKDTTIHNSQFTINNSPLIFSNTEQAPQTPQNPRKQRHQGFSSTIRRIRVHQQFNFNRIHIKQSLIPPEFRLRYTGKNGLQFADE